MLCWTLPKVVCVVGVAVVVAPAVAEPLSATDLTVPPDPVAMSFIWMNNRPISLLSGKALEIVAACFFNSSSLSFNASSFAFLSCNLVSSVFLSLTSLVTFCASAKRGFMTKRDKRTTPRTRTQNHRICILIISWFIFDLPYHKTPPTKFIVAWKVILPSLLV